MIGPRLWQSTAALIAEVALVSVLVTLLLHPSAVAFMANWIGIAGAKLKEARDAQPTTTPLVPGVRPPSRPTPMVPGAPTETIKHRGFEAPEVSENEDPGSTENKARGTGPHSQAKDASSGPKVAKNSQARSAGSGADPEENTEQLAVSDLDTTQRSTAKAPTSDRAIEDLNVDEGADRDDTTPGTL